MTSTELWEAYYTREQWRMLARLERTRSRTASRERGVKTTTGKEKNMKLIKTTALLAVSCIALFGISGCEQSKIANEPAEINGRFINEYVQNDSFGSFRTIIKDTKTGKRYLFVKAPYAGGLAEMPDE